MPKIAMILTPGFADWEYAYIAGTDCPFYDMSVGFFAPTPGEVVSQGGLATQHERNCTVAGICGGTLALARAGLLDDVRHTSNAPSFLADNAPEYAGAPRYEARPAAIMDDHIITAPGTAATSFAAKVFEAAGLDAQAVQQFRAMTAAEHS